MPKLIEACGTVVNRRKRCLDKGYAMEIEIPLMVRIQLLMLATFFGVLAVSTMVLYFRKRTKSTLVMTIAVLVGWLGVGIGWLGPKETIVTRVPAVSAVDSPDALADRPQVSVGTVSRSTSSVLPVTWIIFGSLMFWAGGFFAYSMAEHRERE